MALIFLGAGFKPLIERYLVNLPSLVLYWANMVSAVLDNATLAAAEIGPSLTETQIKDALLGLLISGGMLIPGNIPNIIAAHALHIKSTEWARLGVPLGLIVMAATAGLLMLGWA
jgi:predicted cation transporter